MPDDPGRNPEYEPLIVKFIYDSAFRVKFWKDPGGVVAGELGRELSEAEQYWIKGLMVGRIPQAELIDQLLQGGDDAYPEAW